MNQSIIINQIRDFIVICFCQIIYLFIKFEATINKNPSLFDVQSFKVTIVSNVYEKYMTVIINMFMS